MYYSIPESIRNAGIGLYQYLSLKDSLGYGHNDLRKTVKPRMKSEKVILEVLSGNYENLTDLELFEKQYKTFDIFSYPGIDEARDMINNYLPVCGSLGDVSEFRMFCRTHNIPGISDSYYSEFIGRLDQNYIVNKMKDIVTLRGIKYSYDERTGRIFKEGQVLTSSQAEPVYSYLGDSSGEPVFGGILLKDIGSILTLNGKISPVTDPNTIS